MTSSVHVLKIPKPFFFLIGEIRHETLHTIRSSAGKKKKGQRKVVEKGIGFSVFRNPDAVSYFVSVTDISVLMRIGVVETQGLLVLSRDQLKLT